MDCQSTGVLPLLCIKLINLCVAYAKTHELISKPVFYLEHHVLENLTKIKYLGYCSSFYGITLWSNYSRESIYKLTTAYKRIFRGFYNLDYSNTTLNMLKLCITPFPVIQRKLLYGFYSRISYSTNCNIRTIFNNMSHINSTFLTHYVNVLYNHTT